MFPSDSPVDLPLIFVWSKKIFYRLSQATGKRWEPIQSSTQQIDSVLTAYLSINLSIWLINEYQRLIQTSLEFSGSRRWYNSQAEVYKRMKPACSGWNKITFHQLRHHRRPWVSARHQQGPLEFCHHVIPILGHLTEAICTWWNRAKIC